MTDRPSQDLSVYLNSQGLRSTRQRDSVLRIFRNAGRHLSTEELFQLVRKEHPGIGYATVARTLKLLATAGFAQERHFEDGVSRFEYSETDKHHDHLICTRCRTIVEFENDKIEQLQEQVARQKGFQVQNHRLEIYGLCADCREKNKVLK